MIEEYSVEVNLTYLSPAGLVHPALFFHNQSALFHLRESTAAMSDDEADSELLELLRSSLGLGHDNLPKQAQTRVLEDAEYVSDHSIDVALDSRGTKAAANTIWDSMQKTGYNSRAWSAHELHPKAEDGSTVDFIFTMDLLNFSFWSEKSNLNERFAVQYRGKLWTGYWSLVAALRRALEEGRNAEASVGCLGV